MTLALVRHGRTAWNQERRMQGQSDISLDASGEEQARAAGQLLARASWQGLRSSPLTRARETAAIIGDVLGLGESVLEDRLRERDFGAAEGMPVAEAAERWPSADYPDAEPLDVVRERAGGVLRELLAQQASLVVVSHGVFLRAGVEQLTGDACPRILNGQVVLVDADPERPGFATARILGS